jgi:hypothetical protein
LNQEDIKHLNRFITSNEIEAVIKTLPTMKSPGPDRFITELYKTFNEELTPVPLKLSHKIERESAPPHSFYEVSIILTPKPDKDTTKRKF